MSERAWALYDLIFDTIDYAGATDRLREIVLERKPEARTLLDVACGAGRHLEHLQRWFAVEGLDLSPVLLQQSRLRLPAVPLHHADMRDFDLPRRFDAITCLSSSIAYMLTIDDLCLAIANMARHLSPGGVLIVEPWDSPETSPPVGEPYLVTRQDDDRKVVLLEISKLEGDHWMQYSHYLIATPDRIEHVERNVAQGAFTYADNVAAFEAAGLSVSYDPVGLLDRGLYIGVKVQ